MRVVGVVGRCVYSDFTNVNGCKESIAGIPHVCKKGAYYPEFGLHRLVTSAFHHVVRNDCYLYKAPNKNGIPFREPRLTPINKSSRDRLRKALKVGAVRRLAQSLLDLSVMRPLWILPPGMRNTN